VCVCDAVSVELGLDDLVCVIDGDCVELIVTDAVPELLLVLVILNVIDVDGVDDCDTVPVTDASAR